MIAESGEAGSLIILISDPEFSNKLVLVFKSGETIRVVGVHRGLFSFIEIIRSGRCPNLSPTLGDSRLLPRELPFLFVVDSPYFPIVAVHGCTTVLLYCL